MSAAGLASHDADGHPGTATAATPVTTATVPAFTGGTLPMLPGPLRSESCDYTGNAEPGIKGNIDRLTGEREYHVPGGLFYSTTVIEPSDGELLFCTEADALSQGWKRSKY